MRVETDFGVVAALALSPAIAAVSMRVAQAGATSAQRRAPVDTGELRGKIAALPSGTGARVESTAGHAGYVEFGTVKMRAQPHMRPSMTDCAAAL